MSLLEAYLRKKIDKLKNRRHYLCLKNQKVLIPSDILEFQIAAYEDILQKLKDHEAKKIFIRKLMKSLENDIDMAHGRRLSSEEYQQQVIELQRNQPMMPTAEQDRKARKSALDLRINYRLGVDFPSKRRDVLWAIQERAEHRRLLAIILRFLSQCKRFFTGAELSNPLVQEYAKVLTSSELESFLKDS